MKTSSKILVAVAAGFAAGALLGILFAPDKGTETRRKINKKTKKLAGDVKDKVRKGKEKFNDLKADVERKIEEFS